MACKSLVAPANIWGRTVDTRMTQASLLFHYAELLRQAKQIFSKKLPLVSP